MLSRPIRCWKLAESVTTRCSGALRRASEQVAIFTSEYEAPPVSPLGVDIRMRGDLYEIVLSLQLPNRAFEAERMAAICLRDQAIALLSEHGINAYPVRKHHYKGPTGLWYRYQREPDGRLVPNESALCSGFSLDPEFQHYAFRAHTGGSV